MIKISDKDFDIAGILNSMSKDNPFGCRINSLYQCYDDSLPFVDFWIQENNGTYCSAIARLGTQFIVQLTKLSDIEEISSFLRVAGATSILCDNRYKLDVFCSEKKNGAVLKFYGEPYDIEENYDLCVPSVRETYELLVECKEEGFEAPDFESFNLDVSHKLRHNAVRIIGLKEDSVLKSVAMTVAETETDAVLGAVASHPDCRSKGYGSFMVKSITNELLKENKNIYLHRALDKNVSFYSNLGYKVLGKWCEYYF